MKKDKVLAEAKRLHDLGFAIHWLHKKSKRPIESGWTTGPRKPWDYLEKTYQTGMNVGVRLGSPSKIRGNFLAVIDVDVKSKNPKHVKEVAEGLGNLIDVNTLPEVTSGRGNGSRHYYILTEKPLKPFTALKSKDIVKVEMPSAQPSKKEKEQLTSEELAKGLRLRPAWEIGVMGDGQQVVLPPSLHPDSGLAYQWKKPAHQLTIPKIDLATLAPPEKETSDKPEATEVTVKEDFEVSPVDIEWLPISDKIKDMIVTGEGVADRSAMLLPISHALYKAGLLRNEILTVLTDPKTFIGGCAYDHAKTNSRERAAQWVWKYTLKKVFEESSAEAMFRDPIEEPEELSFDEETKSLEAFEELHHWTKDLEVTKDDKYKTNLRNTVMILENEGGPDAIKRDLFAYRDFFGNDTPWNGKKGEAIHDEDVHLIKLWLSNHYGIEPSDNTIGAALSILAKRNAFDPVRDWLESLPPWDNVERLDTWLIKNFGATGNEEYLAQVFRKWLVAMVMRIYEPGAKFDWMPIFEGAQGVGKSSFGRVLVGDKYFLDWLPDLGNKDSALALQGVWAVEMGELASFRKNEIETVKAFITRTVDKVRPPYGERWLESPRRCVFFGTTNYETYLRDDSGNRRFKPVKVGRLNFEALREEREQLFAEALWLYRSGFENERTLEIEGDARLYEAQIQGEKMIVDDSALMAEALIIFRENEADKKSDDAFNFSKFRLRDLFEKIVPNSGGIGPLENWKFDSRNTQLAGKALKSLGAEKFKSHGVVFWKWEKSKKGV